MRDQSQVLKLKLWFKISNRFPGPDDFKGKVYQTWREELPNILLKLFQKLQRKEHSWAHSMRPTSPWYQKQRYHTEKEYCRPVSLMNIHKILTKIWANWIQKHIKRIIHHDQVGVIPRTQDFFHIRKSISMVYHINKLKNKNHMIITIDAENVHLWFLKKTLQ